ncbi:hypothetical protein H5410_027138 [Solanum commersonii]|uniref:Uncharacterized protein n=1 Tax=Solanum commersonii TaxID=4109 RepID=A0A9J5Z3J6_SOLCO|nr:hypothetical protein H5410_027138 [Solanum commersonii]
MRFIVSIALHWKLRSVSVFKFSAKTDGELLPSQRLSSPMILRFLVVGKPVQLDLMTINKTKPSYARVKVQVDIKGEFSKSVHMDIVNEATGKMRTEVIQIRYDYVTKDYEE